MSLQQPDSLRAALDSVFAKPEYQWVRREDPFAAIKRMWSAAKQWFFDLQEAHPQAFDIALYVLAALMLAVVAHAAWSFFHTVQAAERRPATSGRGARPRDQQWYRAEADRLASASRYAEAIQADFLALVLALDARKVLRFHPSKTPAEYTRDAGMSPDARDDFGELVRRLYRYAFARSPCGPDEFADWRARAAAERYAPAN